MISFKGRHHQQDMILQCVRWYVAYSLSYRDLEELMQERGYVVDHSTIQRWVVHYAPRIEKAFRKNMKRTGLRWRMDETYIDPKEEMPVGHRRTAWLATLGAKLKQHGSTFKKYPPKNIGL